MKLTHPDSKGSIDISPDQADMYLTQGWEKSTKSTARGGDSKGTSPDTTNQKEKGE